MITIHITVTVQSSDRDSIFLHCESGLLYNELIFLHCLNYEVKGNGGEGGGGRGRGRGEWQEMAMCRQDKASFRPHFHHDFTFPSLIHI